MKENTIKGYLYRLREIISRELPGEECRNIIEYYEEYFADAGFETATDIVKELGSAETLARKIIQEHNDKNQNERIHVWEKKGISTGWVILIAILGSPLWLALFCVALGLVITAFSLVIAFGATGIGLALGGIGIIIGGIVLLFTDPILGIYVVGCACIVCAVGLGFIILTMQLVDWIIKIFASLRNKKDKKKPEVNL